MKKKILFVLGAIAIAVALTFNVSVAKTSNSSGSDLSLLASTATAQAEVTPCCVQSYGNCCACGQWIFYNYKKY